MTLSFFNPARYNRAGASSFAGRMWNKFAQDEHGRTVSLPRRFVLPVMMIRLNEGFRKDSIIPALHLRISAIQIHSRARLRSQC